jgi:hypothetical protein
MITLTIKDTPALIKIVPKLIPPNTILNLMWRAFIKGCSFYASKKNVADSLVTRLTILFIKEFIRRSFHFVVISVEESSFVAETTKITQEDIETIGNSNKFNIYYLGNTNVLIVINNTSESISLLITFREFIHNRTGKPLMKCIVLMVNQIKAMMTYVRETKFI